MKMELRSNKTILTSDGDNLVVRGYVNKTNELSNLLGGAKKFREKIAKGAFNKALEKREVDFLAEHDSKLILASTRNQSLQLKEDEQGLYMEATITPTSWGSDYYQLIKSGILKNMSFGFRSIRDSWEHVQGMAIRTIHELELMEVSCVKDPAYSQSTISARGISLVEEVQVPELNSGYSENKTNERGNQPMKKMETRNENTGFEQYLRGSVEARALQTTAQGGAVIPENVEGTIVKKMEEISPVFAKVRKLKSVSGNLKVAREASTLTAGFVGEGTNVAEGAISFDEVKLNQKRVGAAITISNQLANDSAVDILSYSEDLLARRAVQAVEKSILTGNTAEEFRGIIHDADIKAIPYVGAVEEIETEDLQALYLSINPEFLTGASFIMQRDFFNKIAKLKDGNGHFYVQNGVVNGKLTYTLFGMPIDVTQSLPAETPVLFGNFEEAYSLMVKKNFTLTRVQADTTQALRGSQLLVFDGYMDGAVVNPQAVSKLTVSAV
ncbi:phage major capsid protein [Priestia megaterium]|uniref:phage major capsid protein n=1 Tax=Priestia megaterium TaxID=1404 RepID=UPI0021C00610|nr:phage major capsid protein [Priestia megaterium]MCT9858220.1 phage major capsid protein [Priestia megaterium]MDF1958486.1 phage major capsid protein [Priestia megaterium]